MTRSRFRGSIAGVGFADGTRVVLGRWETSPLGAFADVMVERGDGHRLLLAPTAEVAAFVRATYTFDEVVLTPVAVSHRGDRLDVETDPLELSLLLGGRPPLGALLRLLPRPLATAPWFAAAVDPVARRLVPGVRTVGSAGGGRREWYAATDLHRVLDATASWHGTDLGAAGPVDPPVRFGFGSTPRMPSLTQVVTTVEH